MKPTKASTRKKCKGCGEKRLIQRGRKLCNGCKRLQNDLSSGAVLPPDYQDTTYKPYKDPMIPNESGFGFVGAIVQTKTGSHIQCNECGYFYANVGVHLRNKHKIDPREYKEKYGLRLKQGLLSPMERERALIRWNTLPQRKYQKKNAKKAQQAAREKRARGDMKTGGQTWLPQLRNERGRCADQLVEKVKQLYQKLGHVPTSDEFKEEYGSAYNSMKTMHGSYDEAVKKAGLTGWKQRLRERTEKNAEKALLNIFDWYQENGRTPQWKDFNQENILPATGSVQKWFGNVSTARRMARVPDLVNKNGKWVEIPYPYEEEA